MDFKPEDENLGTLYYWGREGGVWKMIREAKDLSVFKTYIAS